MQTRFSHNIPLLDPVEDMNITDPDFKRLVKVLTGSSFTILPICG